LKGEKGNHSEFGVLTRTWVGLRERTGHEGPFFSDPSRNSRVESGAEWSLKVAQELGMSIRSTDYKLWRGGNQYSRKSYVDENNRTEKNAILWEKKSK